MKKFGKIIIKEGNIMKFIEGQLLHDPISGGYEFYQQNEYDWLHMVPVYYKNGGLVMENDLILVKDTDNES